MAVLSTAAVLAVFAASVHFAAGRAAVEVDFFRAMEGANVGRYTIQNNDLASLVGVLKYVHTEALAEHISAPWRQTRKYGIDVIASWRFRVLNPDDLLAGAQVQRVDFGGFVTYDVGVATNTGQQKSIQRYGGYVGVQRQWDARFKYDDPYYWFSVNGFCPNLRWAEKGTEESPNPDCLLNDEGELVRGGLCPEDSTPPASSPSGVPSEPRGDENCTYTHSTATVVRLDELAGVTEQDCGGRRCASWADFRHNCSDASLRFAFDPFSGDVVPVPYCVEYDISPACQADCEAPDCLLLPEELSELGLPFWRGRCSAQRNLRRAERLAAAFGAPGAAGRHAPGAPAGAGEERCAYPGGICNPSPLQGGMYCTRAWAGVCEPCWIPGARLPYPAVHQPLCPYSVLQSVDYREQSLSPVCRSTRPRDLCCLYRSPSTCDPAPDVEPLPLDEDGYALAAFRQDTAEMVAFLTRLATEKLGAAVVDPTALQQLAYWEWGLGPRKGRDLATVETALAPILAFLEGNATATTTTALAAAAQGNSTAALGTGSKAAPSLRGAVRRGPGGPPVP